MTKTTHLFFFISIVSFSYLAASEEVQDITQAQLTINTQCNQCGKILSNRSNLNRHMEIHKSIKRYLCPCCTQRDTDRTNLSRHIVSKHNKQNKWALAHIIDTTKIVPEDSLGIDSLSDKEMQAISILAQIRKDYATYTTY